MGSVEEIVENAGIVMENTNSQLCKWKIVYDIFEIEHRKDMCGYCEGYGHVKDTYCSSNTKNDKEK
ncbi:hypothetical protein J4231_01925 [Candidatus Woesearchaeota archaeon]|nr:hypothetical protein [Candidatus Woesearchaeota archaeon]